MKLLLLLIILISNSVQLSATVWTYTETETGANNVALGYPVPLPVDSLLPVDGFRSYNSLHARHQDLFITHDFINAEIIGQTHYGRDIWAYLISDSDTVMDSGFLTEGAVLQNGTIHSREWASPEVVTAIIERFAEHSGDEGIYDYLINNLNIVIVPVLNVDGFLQTQRYPNQARQTTFFEDPSSWPRDGRMRRKNMRDVDELLSSTDDTLRGVDLNRNHAPFWNTTSRSSSDIRSLVHHGDFAGSEPESQALYAAAELGPADRLRMYIDTHSYSQLWFQPYTNNERRNAIADRLVARMRNATNNTYTVSPNDPGTGIGATDDYFAETYQIPSYTLEIEPGTDQGAQYGGFAVSHSGFVLPESEIARVREELTDASVIAWYMQAGPASIKALQITDLSRNTVVFSGHWESNSATERTWQLEINDGLQNGIEYQVWVAFDKPMRWLDDTDQVIAFPNVPGALAPSFLIEGRNGSNQGFQQVITGQVTDWLTEPGGDGVGYLNYKADAFMMRFTPDPSIDLSSANLLALAFDSFDMAASRIDANPGTVVDYQTHWQNYEDSQGIDSDLGGIDRMIRIIDDGSALFTDPNAVSNPAPAPTPAPTPDMNNSSGGGVIFYNILLLILYLGRRSAIIKGSNAEAM